MAGAFVVLKHDTLLSSNASRNVDSAHKVNSGAVTDTGEYDNFLRVAPKDVPKVKPKHYPRKTSAHSTFSFSGAAATSKKVTKNTKRKLPLTLVLPRKILSENTMISNKNAHFNSDCCQYSQRIVGAISSQCCYFSC
uniref:Uncharacterized protein n=1 Tax=Ditylum brightwellii TaxID=49249 RepID=A0A7S4RVN5_9STRA|mmetsp:Transcript_28801/g.43234  ORF Transcript_28801/g.43234 Transcript_28801/m.43234 type:complete len:137 (+) Transcript_28801:266-676(+)